ncbi:homeobox-leucine zipper protein ATHB-40-like [Aristolochia californica]|uniref:homeobox-leucine zipper protein ATHB-40-like n=1 Tax=Aristolochia californica TaxID=171875 RepID=UPI0035D53159
MSRKKNMFPGLEDDLPFLFHHTSGLYNPFPEGGKPKRRRRRGRADAPVAEPKKRNLTVEQVNFLEINFGNEHKLESARKDRLAADLGLAPRTVAVWFQNRRARWRSKHLEEEYSRLKVTHETVVIDKCHLEAEVLNLRDQLSKAESEIKKLAGKTERSSRPSSSLSVDADYPDLFGEFRAEENQSLLYMLENNHINGLEWANLCGL